MIKAILFDRDGVLINSEIVNIRSSITVLEKMGVTVDDTDRDIIMGKHPLDYVDDFVAKYNIDREDFLAKRMRAYKEMLSHVKTFDDTVSFLNDVRDMGMMTALVTSASKETTFYTLSLFDLSKKFDVIVTFDDVTKRKPSPEPYEKAAELLGLDPQNCLVVEDSLPGVRAAKDAGMICAVRRNEFTANVDFVQADLVVSDTREIKKILLA